ncbi:LexA family protein [Mahella australiensis]|uniref:Transcriptional repressor, LexA family n=1 Tax=Mahella australiensis (strain DSM 15567 / CIP 107919 / 50-1 BON) TaxID=697281 RepID=F4A0E9_MAHA5|nr:LexA family transcriptional regulator [Mahella australiensis]AEE98010.1 transcriptional repressor, LexA family [Mahella australiensis 50-1 BON]
MLTEKQQRILDAIVKYQTERGFAPSLHEIGDMVGLKSVATVYGYICRLEKAGAIRRVHGSPRTIEVVNRMDLQPIISYVHLQTFCKRSKRKMT